MTANPHRRTIQHGCNFRTTGQLNVHHRGGQSGEYRIRSTSVWRVQNWLVSHSALVLARTLWLKAFLIHLDLVSLANACQGDALARPLVELPPIPG
jgi:hypothetical protein